MGVRGGGLIGGLGFLALRGNGLGKERKRLWASWLLTLCETDGAVTGEAIELVGEEGSVSSVCFDVRYYILSVRL